MTRVVAIANQKGGSAKTTTSVHLAAGLGELDIPILLVDLDPQGSASRWLGDIREDPGQDLVDLLTDEPAGEGASTALADLAVPTSAPGVDLVAASPSLAHAERDLAGIPAGALRLGQLLEDLPPRWAAVLLDCPPQLGQLTSAALLAADELLVPVETSALALEGLAELLKTTQRAARTNRRLRLTGILACRVDYRNRISKTVVRSLRRKFGDIAFQTVIRDRVALRVASSHGQPVTRWEPNGDAAADYLKLAAEVVARWNNEDKDVATDG